MNTNYFDFYTLEVHSDKIKPLKVSGIPRKDIESYTDGYKRYGRDNYPVIKYRSTVGFISVGVNTVKEINNIITETTNKYGKFGLKVSVKYHCRD